MLLNNQGRKTKIVGVVKEVEKTAKDTKDIRPSERKKEMSQLELIVSGVLSLNKGQYTTRSNLGDIKKGQTSRTIL